VTGPENVSAAAAVVALTDRAALPVEAVLETFPADFGDVMGYVPVAVSGPGGGSRLVKAEGACSSPFGDSRYDFGTACGAHDLGYDLLRYATSSGGQLGPWARREIDDRFGSDLHERCSVVDADLACTALAALTSAVVEANSWRQGHGNPGSEHLAPYLLAAGLILGALVGPGVHRRIRRGAVRACVRGTVVGSVTR
jgi:hypothetical protein